MTTTTDASEPGLSNPDPSCSTPTGTTAEPFATPPGSCARSRQAATVGVSVVIPVFDEEANLPALFARLYPILEDLGRSYEIIFINDGSRDRSLELLRARHMARPDVTRVLDRNGNRGQHAAIMAGFERVRGETVVTLDADLQNPPEEIPRLLAVLEEGHDCVGGVRRERNDPVLRIWASRIANRLRERLTGLRMTDQGCMLRAYRRSLVEAMLCSGTANTFIPALACALAASPAEVEVSHAPRHGGVSGYSWWKLVRLNLELIAGFSVAPRRWFTVFAVLSMAVSFVIAAALMVRWILLPSEHGALLALIGGVGFVLSGVMCGIGLLGEYVGRCAQTVRGRRHDEVREILGVHE